MSGVNLGMELVLWTIRLFFVIAVALLIGFVVSEHNLREINIEKVEGDIILNRLFYSRDCFAYEDVRTYVGVVDLEKFSDERIRNCMEGDYYIRAELVGFGKIAFNDKEIYEQNIGFCKYGNKFYCYNKQMYVLVNDDGNIRDDILKMDFVFPIKIFSSGPWRGLVQ